MKMRTKPHMRQGLRKWIKAVEEVLGRRPEIGIEIGTFKAESTSILSKHVDHVITIDRYQVYNDVAGTKRKMKAARKQMLDRMKKLHNVSVMKMSSAKAFEILQDYHFDFVYIDGDHNYRPVLRDINRWMQNCEVVGGHDYVKTFPGVIRAVDQVAEKWGHRIETFADGSWLFIRQGLSSGI